MDIDKKYNVIYGHLKHILIKAKIEALKNIILIVILFRYFIMSYGY